MVALTNRLRRASRVEGSMLLAIFAAMEEGFAKVAGRVSALRHTQRGAVNCRDRGKWARVIAKQTDPSKQSFKREVFTVRIGGMNNPRST